METEQRSVLSVPHEHEPRGYDLRHVRTADTVSAVHENGDRSPICLAGASFF